MADLTNYERRLLGTLRTAQEHTWNMNGIAKLGWPTLAEASDFYEALREYQAAHPSTPDDRKEKGDG